MSKLKTFILPACASIAIFGAADARAEGVVFVFDIGVTSCRSSTLPTACDTFIPYRFTETWAMNNYAARAPILYDFGGGNSMLKADAGAGAAVSPEQNSLVLNAAGMSTIDISPGVYFENAVYYTNGVSDGYNVGDLQFQNQTTLKPANGDGTFEYKNYYQSLFFSISGTSFTNVQAMTPGVLAAYLPVGRTATWGEWGTWEHLDNCCTNDGRFTRSDLSLSGTATVLEVSAVPAPAAIWLMLSGLVGLYGRFRLRPVH